MQKKSGIMKSELDAMPLFLLDDLLRKENNPGMKLGVENSGVEMSCNLDRVINCEKSQITIMCVKWK